MSIDFLKKLSSCVWNEDIEPDVFESEWNKVLAEFDLVNHDWLCDLFRIRESWIPAYFRDVFLSGLMRTSSLSESENSFFTGVTNPHLTLVEFYSRFESSLEMQRYTQAKNDNDCENKHPECKTPISLEKDFANVYTINVFYEAQSQVQAALYCCGLDSLTTVNDSHVYTINEDGVEKRFKVIFVEATKKTTCSCKLFQRKGIPCCHMIWVWKAKRVDRVPEQYILSRWTKKPYLNFDFPSSYDLQPSSVTSKKAMINSMWSELFACGSLALRSEADILNVTKTLKSLRIDMESRLALPETEGPSSNVEDIEFLIGATVPSQVSILPPKISKNKGTGVHNKDKRLKSDKEKAIEKNQKPKRQCKSCMQFGYHDSRNCPNKKSL